MISKLFNTAFNAASYFLCKMYKMKNKRCIHLAYDMAYDMVDKNHCKTNYPHRPIDYCRIRALELISSEIYRKNISGCVAEAGVRHGDFAKYMNQNFHDRKLYLYDTYEGFNKQEKLFEIENQYANERFFNIIDDCKGENADANMQIVRSKMKLAENCIFKKGLFPESAHDELGERFAFVSIDMDLYVPTLAALRFFIPRLSNGGYIFLHDYNHNEFRGVKSALEDYEKENSCFSSFPLTDHGGTLVISK